MKDFKEANEKQVNNFKRIYCKSEKKQFKSYKKMKILKITPLIFSEALTNHPICSYASGNRAITKSYILFLVEDTKIKLTIFLFFLKYWKENSQ